MYIGVGMVVDYYFVEKIWIKDCFVKFFVMLISKGMLVFGWMVNYYLL